MAELQQDLALAVRRLVKVPGLTALVVATLALGIGIATAVFAIVDAVVLHPLPFHAPDRLVIPWVADADGPYQGFSYPNFLDWQAHNHTFAHLGFYCPDQFTLRTADGLETIHGSWVSAGYLRALGVEPVLGRLLTPAEADAPGAPVVLLGYDLWQRRFGGDPRTVGRTVEINQVPLTVVGILPPGFQGFRRREEVLIPVPLFERLLPGLRHLGILSDRNLSWGFLLGRLAPAVSPAQALADLETLAEDDQLDLAVAGQVLLQDLRPQVLRLLGAASFVLLIACANVGHLLLTRSAGRHRETAVRAALGATRGRLVRHWLVEGLLLGAAGGAAGLLTAGWSLDLLLAVIPLQIPAAVEIRFGGLVVAVGLALSLLGGGLSALAPALHSAWPDLAGSLRQGGRSASESPASRRTRSLLVAADVALALVLLIGAGLMVRSLERIRSFDPGFRSQGVLALSFQPPSHAADAERIRIKREILKRTAALPGARFAALTSHIFFDRQRTLTIQITAEQLPAATPAAAQVYFVSSGFFQALGIPLEAGRDFLPADHRADVRCAIVNRAFADLYLPPGSPLGRWIALGTEPDRRLEVIGVAGNVRTAIEPGEPADPPQVYLPSLESSAWGFNLVLAAEGDPMALLAPVRRTIRRISPDTAVLNAAALETKVADATSGTRFFTGLMGVCAGIALALAVLAIYSLVVSMIQRETRDIAVRRALGAGPGAILRLVLVRGSMPVLLGIALGLGGAVVLAWTLSAVLFEISPLDPATFLLVPLLFAAAALAACLLAAQRALEIEPMAALRDEGYS